MPQAELSAGTEVETITKNRSVRGLLCEWCFPDFASRSSGRFLIIGDRLVNDMGVIQRLKETVWGDHDAGNVSYSITVCRCDKCRTAFEWEGPVNEEQCPNCDAEQVSSLRNTE